MKLLKLNRLLFKTLPLGLVLLCSSFAPPNDPSKQANAHIRAIFMYNFTKYVEWPEEYRKGDFIVGVVNEQGLPPYFVEALLKLADEKKAGNQNFKIINFKSVDQIGNCHILFVPKESSHLAEQSIAKVKGKKTLVVTESEGMMDKGAAINFVAKNNIQQFEVNKKNASAHDLKMSSTLLSLAANKGQ